MTPKQHGGKMNIQHCKFNKQLLCVGRPAAEVMSEVDAEDSYN
jgi:hypothetical protein